MIYSVVFAAKAGGDGLLVVGLANATAGTDVFVAEVQRNGILHNLLYFRVNKIVFGLITKKGHSLITKKGGSLITKKGGSLITKKGLGYFGKDRNRQ